MASSNEEAGGNSVPTKSAARQISGSSTTQACKFCEALRRKGKFLKKCIHNRVPLGNSPLSGISKNTSSEPEAKSESSLKRVSSIRKVESLSQMFPEISGAIPEEFYSDLSAPQLPTKCLIEVTEPGKAKVKIAVLDIRGALLIITGLFTAFKLDIKKGSVLRKRQHGVLIAVFDVLFDSSDPSCLFDRTRQDLFCSELNFLWLVLKENKNAAVDRLLLQTMHTPSKIASKSSSVIKTMKLSHGSLDENKVSKSSYSSGITSSDLSSFASEYRNHSGNPSPDKPSRSIPYSVKGEDTVGFLFFLSTALTLRDMDVDGITIDGDESSVKDVFYISPSTLYDTTKYGNDGFDKDKIQDSLRHEIQLAVSVLQNFTQVLTLAPNPSQALRNFDLLLSSLERNSLLSEVHQVMHEQTLKRLALILGSSSFLWESFLQKEFADNVDILKDDMKTLESELPSKAEYLLIFEEKVLSVFTEYKDEKVDVSTLENLLCRAIGRFKSRALFRIYIKHLLCPNITGFSNDLNALAEAILQGTIVITREFLKIVAGIDKWPIDDQGEIYEFAICGLGKFGGIEMGFASDLDMMCIYRAAPNSNVVDDKESSLEASVYFTSFVRTLMKFIVDRSSRLGSAFDIDLRLRPHGSNGLESTSFKQFQSYYSLSGNAQQYERQALIRLRFVAGDIGLGKAVEEERNRYVYSCEPIDIDYALHLRQRQILELCESGKRNVKYGRGGIIDLEYAVQYLQLLYGNEHVDVRNPNILAALDEMKNCELLTSDEEEACRNSYLLLRHLIDSLRLVRGNALDLNLPKLDPRDPDFICLAKRLGYWGSLELYEHFMTKIEDSLTFAHQFYLKTVSRVRNVIGR